MSKYLVVAFDCDGVMFDTKEANAAYYNQILEHFGKPKMSPEQFAYVHMHTVNASLAKLFEEEDAYRRAQKYRKQITYHPFIKYMRIEPYLKIILEKITPRYKTAIATNRSDTMQSVLKHHGLEGYFELVISALDVARAKPHPDPLLKIVEHFDISPDQMLYIGDSKLDEQAAIAARIPFAAYKNIELEADYHIENFKELEAILSL